MYIDKKIQEHNLLQAIARVNRVASGKTRGYVVDYIGLAHHLTEALSLYAAADEQAELRDGLKSILSELPILEERYERLIQHFESSGVVEIREFVAGLLPSPAADVAVLHQSVKVLRDIKLRADFEVYFKAFLMSLDIILPNPAANRFRVPAKRFGYLMRMTKERYKDESLDLGDAGEKVKRLINEHLISLGINPKVPPVELLAPDFIEQLQSHAAGNAEAKASEMEHAVRKHCTIHFDEDPAFYKRLSEKLEEIIKRHREQWDVLSEELLHLRVEAAAGRKAPIEGLDKEQSTFYEHLADLAFGASVPPPDRTESLKKLAAVIVECLQETIGIIDFWNNPAEQHRLRGEIADALLMADIPEVTAKYERLAVELLKLARHRHRQLTERVSV
jgi:type I restriction enzyme R subunit